MSNHPVFRPRRNPFKIKPVLKRHKHSKEESRREDKLSWVEKAGFSLVPQVSHSKTAPEIHIRIANEIRTYGGEISSKCQYRWYKIPSVDLETNREFMNGPLARSFGDMPCDVSYNSTAVALFPRIYVLGGGGSSDKDPHNSTVVYSYDIKSPEKGWERRPDMRCARQNPSAVAIEGKVYVFGGTGERRYGCNAKNKPYAEVYDPVLDKWEASSQGDGNGIVDTEVCCGHALFVDRYQKKHVLLPTYYSHCLFTYDISSNSFTLHKSLSSDCAGYKAAVVDGILYYYTRGHINGYDLQKCQWFPEPVRGLCKGTVLPGDDSLSLSLLNVGNDRICIVYGRPLPYDDGKVCVRCSVVRVRKRNSSDGRRPFLYASVQSFNSYIVPGDELEDCIVT